MDTAFLVLCLERNNPRLGSEIAGMTAFIQMIL